MAHIPVMAGEIISIFADVPSGIFIDATFGLGGHTRALECSLPEKFRFIGIDRDSEILKKAKDDLPADVELRNMSFSEIPSMLKMEKPGPIMGVLLDLGLSAMQIDDASRGFSYMKSGPLDMRFDRNLGRPLSEELGKIDQSELAGILKKFGQEKRARAIARGIVSRKPDTTDALVEVVRRVVGRGRFIKSAARVFQALRIFINDELREIEYAISNIIPHLAKGGRLAVISYHSLEDRIIKMQFLLNSGKCLCGPEVALCECGKRTLIEIKTKKPIRPTADEIGNNPRARSARLRYAERL